MMAGHPGAELAIGALSVAIWAYLLLGRGFFWWHAPKLIDRVPALWPAIAIVVPARDEAEGIADCVRSLLGQDYPGPLGLVLVDDHSTDGTAALAWAAASSLGRAEQLRVVAGRPLPPGWSGKLWAVSQGLDEVAAWKPDADYVLLSDADIAHDPRNLAELVSHAEARDLDLTSLMVQLHCATWAERWLVPAFVFFFAMLYPFAWVNRPDRRTAGAAGGCMLVRRRALDRIGGVARIRGDLIDDCALAKVIKAQGQIWLGFSARTRSLRVYRGFGEIWSMVARTAYVQLGHSPLLLGLTVIGMAMTYLAPPALILVDALPARLLGAAAWVAMSVAYMPSLIRYRVSPLWAPLLPLVALFYIGATIDSAWRHYRGRGGQWKGRVYARDDA
jgi:hopene-associated glycosyltransferase HpnB